MPFLLLALAGLCEAGEREPTPAEERRIVSGESWKVSVAEEGGWTEPGFDDGRWKEAATEYNGNPGTRFVWLSPENLFGFPTKAKWMWFPHGQGNPVYFRKAVDLKEAIERAEIVALGDDYLGIHVNGVYVGSADTNSGHWQWRGCARVLDVRPFLRKGRNTVAVLVKDTGITKGALVELRLNAKPVAEVLSRLSPRKAPPSKDGEARVHYSFQEWSEDTFRTRVGSAGFKGRNYGLFLWNFHRLRRKGVKTVEILIENLRSDSEQVVEETVAGLGLLDAREATSAVADLLAQSAHARTRLLAVAFLRRSGQASHIPLFRRLIESMAPAPETEVRELIRKLGSDDFFEREKATEKLKGLGASGLGLVLEALESDDPEVRQRAQDILAHFSKTHDTGLEILLRRNLEEGLKELEGRKK